MESARQKLVSSENGDEYKEAIDIYKMEYERCTQRYNDLYSAIWTNFSYMALVAGGLLTFGGARFVTALNGFLACLPLLFWWLATFEPLNRYADKVEQRIVAIEEALTTLSTAKLKDVPETVRKGLQHFTDFAKRGSTEKPTKIEYLLLRLVFVVLLLLALSTFLNIRVRALSMTLVAVLMVVALIELLFDERRRQGIRLLIGEYPRVRFRVRIAAWVLLIMAICFGVRVGQMLKRHESLTVPISKTSQD